jgi:hypothetical protein
MISVMRCCQYIYTYVHITNNRAKIYNVHIYYI